MEAEIERVEKSSNIADFEAQKKKAKRNKYAFACAILASMTSILLGYGNLLSKPSILLHHLSSSCFLVLRREVCVYGERERERGCSERSDLTRDMRGEIIIVRVVL